MTNDFNSEPQVLVSDLAQRKKHSLAQDRARRAPLQIVTGSVRPCGCAPPGKLTPSTTTANPATWLKAFCRFTSVWEKLYKIDQVEVDWPSRRKQVLTTGIEENQTLRITEPK